MSKLRTGRLSVEDIAYISENSDKPIEELAEELQRTPEIIAKYIRLNAGEKSTDAFGNEEVELDLTKLPFWTDIINEFTLDEQNKIRFDWNKTIDQFMGDVLYSEQMQILDMIKFDVLMNRLLKERHHIAQEITKLENLVKDELEKDLDDRNIPAIDHWHLQIANYRASQEVGTKQYKDYNVEKAKLLKDMKATREQRQKALENTKENFPQWLSKLMKDRRLQEKLGERMAKMRLAAQKERKRLAQFHTYEDGMVDRPFLTPEVIKEANAYDQVAEILNGVGISVEEYLQDIQDTSS